MVLHVLIYHLLFIKLAAWIKSAPTSVDIIRAPVFNADIWMSPNFLCRIKRLFVTACGFDQIVEYSESHRDDPTFVSMAVNAFQCDQKQAEPHTVANAINHN